MLKYVRYLDAVVLELSSATAEISSSKKGVVMEASARRSSLRDFPWGEIEDLAIILAIIAGIICLLVFVVKPAAERHDAAVSLHNNQQLAAIHRLGFTKITSDSIGNDGFVNYFDYAVGSCTVKINIMRAAGQYKVYYTYIWLKSVEDSRVFVTASSLQKLPQMASCFAK